MSRTALFHDDPRTTAGLECTDDGCGTEHHEIEVRGQDSVETWACEHKVETIHWYDLTPTDHPLPSCDVRGCPGPAIQEGT